jgi:hypothetical protein
MKTVWLRAMQHSRIVIRKSNEHQIWFLTNFKSTFQALKWAFVFPKGQKSATVNREDIFFLKKGHVGYKKNPSSYVDFKNVNFLP